MCASYASVAHTHVNTIYYDCFACCCKSGLKNIKLLDCVTEHGFIHEFIFSTWLIHTLFIISWFNAQSVTISEILTVVGSDNKVKSWLGFFEILWWHNEIGPCPDVLAKWQHHLGGIPSWKLIIIQTINRIHHRYLPRHCQKLTFWWTLASI